MMKVELFSILNFVSLLLNVFFRQRDVEKHKVIVVWLTDRKPQEDCDLYLKKKVRACLTASWSGVD